MPPFAYVCVYVRREGGSKGGGVYHACERETVEREKGGYGETIPLQMETQAYISVKTMLHKKSACFLLKA